ncbi:MAG: low-specificity L-threonine aldolase [Nitrospinaceae bacterium]
MNPIDLRSDTLTQPTSEMREAMARAKVGDDVFQEDPTLRQLEETAAEKLGKEAALFVPSGTMGNLVCVLTHCRRGDEAILGDRSHIFLNEAGGISALGGVHPHILPNAEDGTLPLDSVEKAVRPVDIHYPPSRLLCLENTHNYCMGSPLSPEYMEQAADLAHRYSLRIHLDGARIFNAAAALGVDVKRLARHADSVMFSLSKGLSAPVGSLICGSGGFIQKARKMRKMVGGGMRQAGHLAATGLVALEHLAGRLQEDHDHAKKLAEGLSSIPGIELNAERVQTNIVFFGLNHPRVENEIFLQHLESEGIKILMIDPGTFRAVLHREISGEDVSRVIQVVRAFLS